MPNLNVTDDAGTYYIASIFKERCAMCHARALPTAINRWTQKAVAPQLLTKGRTRYEESRGLARSALQCYCSWSSIGLLMSLTLEHAARRKPPATS